jgi:hypothetical protein
LIPKCVTSEYFPCKFQEERIAAIFSNGAFDDFDIICIQECFDGLPGSVKQIFILYAQKAGFLYITSAEPPALHHLTSVCGGEMILSRFPILR